MMTVVMWLLAILFLVPFLLISFGLWPMGTLLAFFGFGSLIFALVALGGYATPATPRECQAPALRARAAVHHLRVHAM